MFVKSSNQESEENYELPCLQAKLSMAKGRPSWKAPA